MLSMRWGLSETCRVFRNDSARQQPKVLSNGNCVGAIKEGFPVEVTFGPNLKEEEGFEQREKQPNGN